ncbi:MAG TPA: RNA polymerase sigma factor [Pyrinomonadaceae bacterium]|nr:RNA polymerase sigma factor [Pyrinomonadaceae bacterium]
MDETIFEEIYEQTARPLWAYVARISGNTTAADDILQETFLRFLNLPPKNNDLKAVKPYLYKIATNLVYDRFRKLKREGVAENILPEKSEMMIENFGEELEMIQVFSRLKQQERALLWLAYVEGYEHREIAQILKLNAMSVRVLLFRARRKLAEILEGEKK